MTQSSSNREAQTQIFHGLKPPPWSTLTGSNKFKMNYIAWLCCREPSYVQCALRMANERKRDRFVWVVRLKYLASEVVSCDRHYLELIISLRFSVPSGLCWHFFRCVMTGRYKIFPNILLVCLVCGNNVWRALRRPIMLLTVICKGFKVLNLRSILNGGDTAY